MNYGINKPLRKIIFFILMFAFSISISNGLCGDSYIFSQSEMKEEIYSRFSSMQPDGASLGPTGSELAWGESYILMGLLSAYEATGDTLFLNRICKHAENIFSIRDDFTIVKDEFRNRIMPAWSSSLYTKDKNYAWIVHAGMVSFPLARFVYLTKKDPVKLAPFKTRADLILCRIKETVAGFVEYYIPGPGQNEGHYYGFYIEKVLPLNQQNAMGRTLTALWLATGDKSYREKAAGLANYFKNRLRYDKNNDAYDWPYWADLDRSGEGSEDISHAAINADFVFQCYRAGIVFDKTDMKRFSNTVVRVFAAKDSLPMCVDGTGEFKIDYAYQAGRWLHLGYLYPETANSIYRHVSKPLKEKKLGIIPSFLTCAYFLELKTLDFKKEKPVK